MTRHHRESVTFTVVVTLLALVGAAAMLLVIALSGAPTTLALATLLAFLPVGPVVACFLWLDRYEPEPRALLAAGLVWGGCVATFGALVLQGVGGLFGGFDDRQMLALVAPVTEEATKGLFLLLLLWWRRGELDGVLDGLVYAGMVGVGFAFVENILYLAAAYDGTDGLGPGGTAALTTTFVVRCLVSPFAHPFFTAFLGIGIGLAVSTRSGPLRVAAPFAGYVMAVTAHALWNSAAFDGSFIVVYLTLMAPAFAALIVLAGWLRSMERKMLARALQDAAARGLLPATDIRWLVDLPARRMSRSHARQVAGDEGERAMREYQQAAVELGFLHHRYLRGTAPPDFAARGQTHVARLRAVRPLLSFPGQVVPPR